MVDVGVKVLVGVSVGVAVAVVVDVGVRGVAVAVAVCVGVLVTGDAPAAIRVMALVHLPHVTTDMLAGAAGLHPVLALASTSSRGAAAMLGDSRERNIAASASFTIALFLLTIITTMACLLLPTR